jgi:hypothetical protein
MSMAARTNTQSPVLHVAESHDPRAGRGAYRHSPECLEGIFSEVRMAAVHPHEGSNFSF